MLYLIATLTIKHGTMQQVIELATPCINATRNEAGCVYYDLTHSVTEPNTIYFVECWKSRADLDAHFNEPHLIAWAEAGAPFITSRKIEIIENGAVETR